MLTKNDIQQIAQLLKPIENRLETLEGRLGGVEGRLGGVEGRLEGVEGRLGKFEVGQEELKKELKLTNKKLTRLQKDVSYITKTFDSSIVDLQVRVKKLETRITI